MKLSLKGKEKSHIHELGDCFSFFRTHGVIDSIRGSQKKIRDKWSPGGLFFVCFYRWLLRADGDSAWPGPACTATGPARVVPRVSRPRSGDVLPWLLTLIDTRQPTMFFLPVTLHCIYLGCSCFYNLTLAHTADYYLTSMRVENPG